MASYRSYQHLEKLQKDCVKDIVYSAKYIIQPKLDGTNGSIWFDTDTNSVQCGSRNREISIQQDNAGFAKYILTSEDEEIVSLRKFVTEHPQYIIYGEFIGVPGHKKLGTIKSYLENGFFVFDVYDTEKEKYLPYQEWYDMIYPYSRCIPTIGVETSPLTIEELIEKYKDKTSYNLPESQPGEGIVIKAEPAYHDSYGNLQIGKIVFDEFIKTKSQPKKVPLTSDEAIAQFCDSVLTDAFLEKELNKIYIAMDIDALEGNKGAMSRFIMTVVNTVMEEEFWGYFKKHLCVLDLAALKGEIIFRTKKFIHLI